MKKITKAVIPAAGLGTRVLPASKSVPKEMLNIVDKPAIQYIVEEAAAAGITDILIITNRGKGAIEDHFDHSFELEKNLEGNASKRDLYESVLAYHFISPSNPVNPEIFLILGAKIRRKFETTKFFKEKIILKIPNSLK